MGTVFEFTEPYEDFDPEVFATAQGFTIDYAASEFDQESGNFTLAFVETLTESEKINVAAALNDEALTTTDGTSQSRGTTGRYIVIGAGHAYRFALYAGDNRAVFLEDPAPTLRRVAGADPVDAEDFVTLGFLLGTSGGAGVVRSLELVRLGSAGAGYTESTTVLATTDRVLSIVVRSDLDGGATGEVGWNTDADALVTSVPLDGSLPVAVQCSEPSAGTRKVRLTVGGAPTTGTARVTITYATPAA